MRFFTSPDDQVLTYFAHEVKERYLDSKIDGAVTLSFKSRTSMEHQNLLFGVISQFGYERKEATRNSDRK